MWREGSRVWELNPDPPETGRATVTPTLRKIERAKGKLFTDGA